MKKAMHIISSQCRLVEAMKLEGQNTVTVKKYTTKCISDILQEGNVKGYMLYHDNSASHTIVSLTVEIFEQKYANSHWSDRTFTPFFPMCDFWLD